MADANEKSNEVKNLKKKISKELNEIDKDIEDMEKSKKDSVEKIEIKKVELKKFTDSQAVCDEHYATLQEIEQASKVIEERKISITALDTTIANLDMQIAKIQSEHDKAVAELEKKRSRLNDYLKYYEDLNDKLEKLIELLGEEEKKHCIELNKLKVERDKALARTDLSENALNKLLGDLDNKMVDLNQEHGKLIDSISQKLSEITVDASEVEQLLSEKKTPAKKKKKSGDEAGGGEEGTEENADEERKEDEEDESDEEGVKATDKKEKKGKEKSEGEKAKDKGEKMDEETSEGLKKDAKSERKPQTPTKERAREKDQEDDDIVDEEKRLKKDEEYSEDDYESDSREGSGSVAKSKKKMKKKSSLRESEVDFPRKVKKKKKEKKSEGESEEEDDDSFDIDDEELDDWFASNEKDLRSGILRQGMQITPSNRIITQDGRIVTLKEAQSLGLFGEGTEEEEGYSERSDFRDTSKKKKYRDKEVKYYQSPASSDSTLGKESSESHICGRDVEYLKVVFGKSLTIALAEITAIQPIDPIHYLAHWMLKYRYNQEIDQITRIQIQELMIEQERLAAEKWHRELQEEARLAVLEALFRAENIIIQQDFQSQLVQEYEGEYEDSPPMAV